jgi:hypothetical protein
LKSAIDPFDCSGKVITSWGANHQPDPDQGQAADAGCGNYPKQNSRLILVMNSPTEDSGFQANSQSAQN